MKLDGFRVFVKDPEMPPYEGAKNYFLVEDVENRTALIMLATATCEAFPEPKPKKRRKTRESI